MLSIMPTSPAQYSSAGSSSSPTLSVEETRHVVKRRTRTTTEVFYKKRRGEDKNQEEEERIEAAPKVATYGDDFESETDIECDAEEGEEEEEGRKSKEEFDSRKEEDDEHDVAFTILQDDDLEVEDTNVDVGDEGIGSTEELCVNHARKAKRASSGIFEVDSSPESHGSDIKVLSPANASLLQAKLMALTHTQDNTDHEDLAYTKKLIKSHEYLQKIHKSPDTLQDDLFKKNTQKVTTKQFDRINNLSREKVLSQSNGNLHHQKTFILKKDYSQSYNNIEKRSDYSRYHQNCYIPGKMSTKSPSGVAEQKVNKTRGKRSVDPPPTFNITAANNNNRNVFSYKNYDTRNLNNGLKNNTKNGRIATSCKPVFVTTVKKGEFLEPPPEIAYLLGYGLSSSNSANGSNNSLNSGIRDRHQQQALFYSFSSQPRVLNQARSRDKTPNKIIINNNNNSNINNNLNNSVKSTHQRSKRSVKTDDEESNITYGNLMYDRRVVRGSTIAQSSAAPWNPYFGYAKLLSQPQTNEDIVTSRQQEARRRAIARRRAQGAQSRANQWKGSSPPPVSGRRHEVVQTDKFLEELFLNPPETEVACQTTELFPEVPETPPFVTAPLGVDAETQVYPGELFDWDAEVASLMEVLVAKNIQDALAEVLEEEELAVLQDQQRQGAELRAVQLLRDEQQVERDERDNEAAAILTKRYLAETLPSVLEGLKEAGYMLDDVKVDGEEGLMPWLMLEVSSEMNHMVNSKDILTDIVREILETRAEIYRVMSEEEGKELDLEDSEVEGEGEGNRELPELETT